VSHHQRLELFQHGNTGREVSVDLDDMIGRWHLQDQVPVVGNGHELVQSQPANDGIEGEVDLHNVEDDALRAVVLKRPERHSEGDATARNDGARAHT
jgi:hypothetical protein